MANTGFYRHGSSRSNTLPSRYVAFWYKLGNSRAMAAMGSSFSTVFMLASCLPSIVSADGVNRPLIPSGKSVPGYERYGML